MRTLGLLAALAACGSPAPTTVEVRADDVAFVAVQDLATGAVLGRSGSIGIEGPYVVTRVCGTDVRSEVSFASTIDVSCPPSTGEVVTLTAPGAFQVHLGPASGFMESTMDLRVPAGRWDLVAIAADTGAVLIRRDVVIDGATQIALDPADAVLPERRVVRVNGGGGAAVTLETELVTPLGTRVTWPGDGDDALVLASTGGQRVRARTAYVGYTSTSASTTALDAPIALDLPTPLTDATVDLTPAPSASWDDSRAWTARSLTLTQYPDATPRRWTLVSHDQPLAQPSLAPLRESSGWDDDWELEPGGGYRWLLELADESSSVTWLQAR